MTYKLEQAGPEKCNNQATSEAMITETQLKMGACVEGLTTPGYRKNTKVYFMFSF